MKKDKQLKEHISPEMPATYDGLRDLLFDEINLVRAGKVSVARARVVSQLARRVIEAATMDLYAKGLLGAKDVPKLNG